MPNSYVKTSFELRGTPSELDLLVDVDGAIERMLSGEKFFLSGAILSAFPPSDGNAPNSGFLEAFGHMAAPLCVKLERNAPDMLSIYSSESASVDDLGEAIRRCCPSSLPFAFIFGVDCDRPLAGAYSGGYILITKDSVGGVNADAMAAAALADARANAPLSDVQRVALEAYDQDGSIMYILDGGGQRDLRRVTYDGTLGDELPLFIAGEAHDANGDFAEAADMMERAARDLETVADALRAHTKD